jgi:hypothetical protein
MRNQRLVQRIAMLEADLREVRALLAADEAPERTAGGESPTINSQEEHRTVR